METIARFIVKHRAAVLILASLLLIPAALGAVMTGINYDVLTYLPPELDSMLGERSLDEDFGLAATGMISVEGLPYDEVLPMKAEIAAVPGVREVLWLNELIDPAVPPGILPDELDSLVHGANDASLMVVRFEGAAASQTTMQAVAGIKQVLREGCFFGGMAVILQDTKALVDDEMPLYIACAVGACLVVLFLALQSSLAPLVFMLGILYPIVYNFGTNYFLGEISYITQALAAVLQLGVTMDFSIFLLHRYEEERAARPAAPGPDPDKTRDEEAMVTAICRTFSSISASSLTTIAGFLALCAMRLTLGRDIGLVMAKGVLFGVLSTLTVLPALILCLRKPLDRHRHRTFIPKLARTSHGVARRYGAILLIFVLLFIPFPLAQRATGVYYTLFDSLPQDLTGIVGTDKLGEDFGIATPEFALVDENLPAAEIRALCQRIEQLDGVSGVMALEKYLGSAIPETAIPQDVRDLLHAGGYRLLLITGRYEAGTDECNRQVDETIQLLKQTDPGALLTGEAPLTKDLIEVADVDFAHVNVWSIAAVFVIIAISFKSLSIPLLLVAAIEAAITVNMGIPYFGGTTLPFIASIVIGTIQLGATVDYAILMTTRFHEELLAGRTRREAAQQALEHCSESILTSGLTFFAATVGVYLVSRMELLKSLCLLISRGALISMFVILFILPCLLILCEPVVAKTTLGWRPRGHKPQQAAQRPARPAQENA